MSVPRRSLLRRLMIGFVATTSVLWVLIALVVIWQAFRLGDDQQRDAMRTYARQILAAAVAFAGDPVHLMQALEKVQAIEIENAGRTDDPNTVRMQVWRDGVLLGPTRDLLPVDPPPSDPPRQTFEHQGRRFNAHVVADADTRMLVRVALEKRGAFSLMWPSAGFVFVPLLLSLPLLLVPAWFTLRSGLAPLRDLVGTIEGRVRELDLSALQVPMYRELRPLGVAVNELMSRLHAQLTRERAFLADVAHEMKTPLAIMQANLDIARAPPGDPSDAGARREAALRDLDTGIARANRLIRQLLGLSRLEADDRRGLERRVDLAEFVRERAALLVPVADRRGLVITVEAPDAHVCSIDPEAVGAIVDNLLENAIKYSPAGGRIRVALAPSGTTMLLSVADRGPGIDGTARQTVFERFRRAGADHPGDPADGVGLGLAIVRRAVDRLGGTITLAPNESPDDDESGNGPTVAAGPGLLVRVTLPCAADDTPATPARAA